MGFPAKLVADGGGAVSTTLNGTSHVTNGGVVGGNKVTLNNVVVGSLSAYLDVIAKTNTMTLTGKWQVSQDGTNWRDIELTGSSGVASSNTPRILSTGTGSAVEAKTVLPAPDMVYGYRFCRVCVVVGVADSADPADAWAYSYSYQRSDFV